MKNIKHLSQLLLLICAATFSTVHAAPLAPTLISPQGMQSSQPPVFVWSESTDSTWYRVWVKDETGVVVADWVKASTVCNIVGDGICSYEPMVGTTGVTVWQVRGYDGELGAWSTRGMFFDTLSRPGPTTLLAPLVSTDESTPMFSWTLVPQATWYKIQITDQFENLVANQWLRANSANVDCDVGTSICSKTPMVLLPLGNFEWRVRTYNAAGLGPWTPPAFVTIVQGSPLSATPNPVQIFEGSCQGPVATFEIMVTNNSNNTVTGIDVLPAEGGDILGDGGNSNGPQECEVTITSLESGQSCVITREYFGDTNIPGSSIIPVAGDNITRLEIEVEIDFCPPLDD